jgi:hypothetical protein
MHLPARGWSAFGGKPSTDKRVNQVRTDKTRAAGYDDFMPSLVSFVYSHGYCYNRFRVLVVNGSTKHQTPNYKQIRIAEILNLKQERSSVF